MSATDMKIYMANRRAERRAYAIDYLGGICMRCGSKDDLEFDHINRTTKRMGIADMYTHSMENLHAELDKCQLLCKQHHIEKSRECGDTVSGGPHTRKEEPVHGTAARYSHNDFKCRCNACKKAKSLYAKKLIAVREVVK